MIVVSRNWGGAYILCELDGTLYHAPVAAFRVIPYLTQKSIEIPNLEQHIDVNISWLWKLEHTTVKDLDDPDSERFEEIHGTDRPEEEEEEDYNEET